MTNQKAIFKVCTTVKDYKVQYLALGLLTDQDLLGKIPPNTDNQNLQKAALKKLEALKKSRVTGSPEKAQENQETPKKQLEGTYKAADKKKKYKIKTSTEKDISKKTRAKSIIDWENAKLKPEIANALQNNDWRMRKQTVKELNPKDNEGILTALAEHDECMLVRREAIKKLDYKRYKKIIDQELNRNVGIKHASVIEADKIRLIQKRPDSALAILSDLILNDPSSLEGGALHVMGYIFMEKGMLYMAEDYFQQNLEVFPHDSSTFMCLGLINEILGYTSKAKEYYQKAPEREWDPAYLEKIRQAYLSRQ